MISLLGRGKQIKCSKTKELSMRQPNSSSGMCADLVQASILSLQQEKPSSEMCHTPCLKGRWGGAGVPIRVFYEAKLN